MPLREFPDSFGRDMGTRGTRIPKGACIQSASIYSNKK